MPRYALLLRGVNVGGHGKLSMADLRSVLTSLGHTEVRTYLQSGNAVVTATDPDPARVAGAAEDALAAHVGQRIPILVRTNAELRDVMTANPFEVVRPALLHVLFLSEEADPADLADVDADAYRPDEFHVEKHAVYLRFAESAGRSRLPDAVGRALDRAHPGIVVTARNWNTVRKLAELTAPAEPAG